MMRRTTKSQPEAKQTFNAVVVTPNIAGNVAAAQQRESKHGAMVNSSVHSSAHLGGKSYNPKLGGSCSLQQIISILRNDVTNQRHSGRDHWLNYYLSLKFVEKRYEKFPDHGMQLDEFYTIASRYYSLLVEDAKLNFAKVSIQGVKKLIESNVELSKSQWETLLNDDCIIKKSYFTNQKSFNTFFSALSHENQQNVRSVLRTEATQSKEQFLQFLAFFELQDSKEYDTIARGAHFKDLCACNKACDTPEDLLKFLNQQNKYNRIAIITSQAFASYNRSGIAALIAQPNFNADNFTIDDFLTLLNRLDKNHQDYKKDAEKILKKIAFSLIANYDSTIRALKNKELARLHASSPLFQHIIRQCAIKHDYERNKQQQSPIAFNVGDDISFITESKNEEKLELTPPTHFELIITARNLKENGLANLAVGTYCQAMNLGQNDIHQDTLQQAFTLAINNGATEHYRHLDQLFKRHFTEETTEFGSRNNPCEIIAELVKKEHQRKILVQASGQAYSLDRTVEQTLVGYTRYVVDQAELNPLCFTQQLESLKNSWQSVLALFTPGSQKHLVALSWYVYASGEDNDNSNRTLNLLYNTYFTNQQRCNAAILRLLLTIQTHPNPSAAQINKCFKFRNSEDNGCFAFFTNRLNTDEQTKSTIIRALNSRDAYDQFNRQVEPLEFSNDNLQHLRNTLIPVAKASTALLRQPTQKGWRYYGKMAVGGLLIAGGAALILLGILKFAGTLTMGAPAAFGFLAGGVASIGLGVALIKKTKKSAAMPTCKQYTGGFLTANKNYMTDAKGQGAPSAPPPPYSHWQYTGL